VNTLGRVVRLQVQTASLKLGPKPRRVYDPSPLQPVASLRLSPRGAVGVTAEGEAILDVHHADHPATKHEPGREVSFGFTSHYAKMRARYGERLVIGCAGENILLDAEADRVFRLEDLGVAGLALRSGVNGALVRLGGVAVADPCVEFSRFALGDSEASPQDVKPALQFLDAGTRGYVFTPVGELELRAGDSLVALL
jgi:hypothetical protein